MRVIRRLSRLLLPGLTMFLLFCGSASASWIRFLLVEDLRPGHPDMQVIEQSWGGNGPWTSDDPNLGGFFGNYASNYAVSHAGPGTITLSFDLFKDPDDPSQGAGMADVGQYNFFNPGTDVLTALLSIQQLAEHVTISYVSVNPATPVAPLPGGHRIDGVAPAQDVDDMFGSSADGTYIPVCDTLQCVDSRSNSIFPLGLGLGVTRIPEPSTFALLIAAWGSLMVRARSGARAGRPMPTA